MVPENGSLQGGPASLRTPLFEEAFDPVTLIDLLRYRATHQPGREAYAFLGGEAGERSVSYEELDRQARIIASRIQGAGVAVGERVLLLYPPGLEYVAAFLGCLYAGAIAVPAYPPRLNRPISRLRAIATDSRAELALSTARVLSNVERRLAHAPEMKSLPWMATDDGDEPAGEWRRPEVAGDTLAFLQYTSGSTAAPKGVMVTHANLLHNLALLYHYFGHGPDSQMVSWLPPYHDMGLIVGVLQPLYGGFPAALMPPVSFLQRPLGWLHAISRLRADSAGAPNFAYDLCARKATPEDLADLDLSGWTLAFNGAEPVHKETLERFAAVFAPCGFRPEALYPAYGLAEATVFASGGSKPAPPVVLSVEKAALGRGEVIAAPAGNDARALVGCGRALKDQRIVVVDPESLLRCPDDRVGEIWMSGPSVAQGYWERPEQTDGTFRAYLADTGEGPFLRTGDLGFLHHGELFVTGRLKDIIVIRGLNHYPQDIEKTVEQCHAAMRHDGCAAFAVDAPDGERLVVVQELERRFVRDSDLSEVIASVRRAVAEHHELRVHAVVLVRTGSIPKTSSGKIRRRATRAAYMDGTLATVAADELPPVTDEHDAEPEIAGIGLPARDPDEAHVDAVLSIVGEFVRRRGHSERARPADSLQGDLGLDSLAVAELLIEVETAFELPLGDALVPDLRTVKDVCEAVGRALQTGAPDASAPGGLAGLQEQLFSQIPQLGAVVSEQDGRNVKIDGRWYCDFASANYLGLDLHPEVLASIPEATKRWGAHPSWTRAVASPQIYEDLEREIAGFVGAPHVLVFPTVTLLHGGVLPVLAGSDGAIILDRSAHNSVQEAASLAASRGTVVDWFDHNDPHDLERRLEFHKDRSRKIVAVDGVYSMSGAYPPLPEFARLARRHGARVYVDDAHGLGVIGENPTPDNPYGHKGNGVVRHFGLRHGKEIVYVGGMSKAFSSMVAFVSCADEEEKRRLSMASTAVFSGPCPTASLASALAALKISRDAEGEAIRRRLLALTGQLVAGARAVGFEVDNNKLFPLVGVRIGEVRDVIEACHVLWEHGILITPAVFPAVPVGSGALRFTVTAVNTEDQVRLAIEALQRVYERLVSRDASPAPQGSETSIRKPQTTLVP